MAAAAVATLFPSSFRTIACLPKPRRPHQLRRTAPSDSIDENARRLGNSAPSVQQRNNWELVTDKKEHRGNGKADILDPALHNAVVKVFTTHTESDILLPWQKQKQYTSTSSAFMIGNDMLVTNAHCVEYGTQIKVKKRGGDTKYVAKVLAIGIDCDLALLAVENKGFWKDAEPLRFGNLPSLQDSVTVVGYPLGGDTMSVTKGVVSRIEVISYGGESELLAIQIDAAINSGNSGGPAFNDQGECIGVAFQVYRSRNAENIGYVIPSTIVTHFLIDYERNGKYTGFPCLGTLNQKLENPAMHECLKAPRDQGILVRRVEPTSPTYDVLKKGDVIVSFDGIPVGSEGTVQFRSTERIAFRYLISQKFSGDVAELGIIRAGTHMIVQTILQQRVHLVPDYIDGGKPSYLIVGGLVFTPLTEPFVELDMIERRDILAYNVLAKVFYSIPRFKGEQIVMLSQVLAHEVNFGYADLEYRQVIRLNGTEVKNISHLAYLVDNCKDKYLAFEFDHNLAVLEKEAAMAATKDILSENAIPSDRSSDLKSCVCLDDDSKVPLEDANDCPVASELEDDGLLWA